MIPSWDGPLPKPDVRTVRDMQSVLAEPVDDPDRPLYYMYRECARTERDRVLIAAAGLRFDITVIPPGRLGREFVKTKGHFHPLSPDGVGYPEIYGVMEGEAWYLLQSRDGGDAVIIRAGEGDLVLIPPGYGHITVNPGVRDLVMANFVSSRFESDYRPFEEHRGGLYYSCFDGTFRANPRWPRVVPLRETRPKQYLSLGIIGNIPLYSFTGNLGVLAFLNEPSRFPSCLEPP